jgi:spoIIIJ-associated protein
VTETDPRTSGEDEQGGGIATAESEIATTEPVEVVDAPEDDDAEMPRAVRGRPSLRRLEEEGEVAADYLEELLDIADLDGDIDIDVENGRASVAIVTESGRERELRGLVGGEGEVLEALQELARLAVQAKTGERSRLMLDVAGYRAGRRRALEDVAARAVAEVRRTAEPVRLEPMNAFERKVVHDAVAEAGLVSESEGVEPGRRVVVLPAD